MSHQKITVQGKIKVEAFSSLRDFLFGEIPKLFYVHFKPSFQSYIESTSYAVVKAESAEKYLKFRLALNSSWIQFRLEKPLDVGCPLLFLPHRESDENIIRLCEFLNDFHRSLEGLEHKASHKLNAQHYAKSER
ncbi:MAG: hypothetical protein HC880_00640 [Bacteroidia bacterium]|nr:hypothetical protein [Bacteroidia bacterium]